MAILKTWNSFDCELLLHISGLKFFLNGFQINWHRNAIEICCLMRLRKAKKRHKMKNIENTVNLVGLFFLLFFLKKKVPSECYSIRFDSIRCNPSEERACYHISILDKIQFILVRFSMDVRSATHVIRPTKRKEKRGTKWKCARKIVHISDGFATDIL